MSKINRKRRLEDPDITHNDKFHSKRTKGRPEINSRGKPKGDLEVPVPNMTPDERRLVNKLFKFPIISADIICNICDVDISKSAKIAWTDWFNPKPNYLGKRETPFIYCLECLKNGKEKHEHKSTHSYSVVDRMDFPLFDENWTAQEDITLLKGISLCGIDNWHQISENLSLKTPTDWETHFYSFYYKSINDPMPVIEDIATQMRGEDASPILNPEILEENINKKEILIEKQKNGPKHRDSEDEDIKKEDTIADTTKKQGNAPFLSPPPHLVITSNPNVFFRHPTLRR